MTSKGQVEYALPFFDWELAEDICYARSAKAIKLGLGKLEIQHPFKNIEIDLDRLDIKNLPFVGIAAIEVDNRRMWK